MQSYFEGEEINVWNMSHMFVTDEKSVEQKKVSLIFIFTIHHL